MRLRTLAAAALATCVLGFSAAALAETRTVTSNAQMRDGNNNVIGNVASGSAFNVEFCSGDFCFGSANGIRGWVPQSQLSGAAAPPPGNQPLSPNQIPQQQPGANGPGFSFNFDFGNPQPRNPLPPKGPGRPSRDAEVCFFELPNYRGQSFCVSDGDEDRSLSRRWNDRISSIQVDPGLTVTVCRDNNYRGTCAEISDDVRRLPSRLDDAISSYEVYH